MSMDHDPARVVIAVRRCRVVDAEGAEMTERTAFCPRRARSQAFERCCGCVHMKRIDVEDDGDHGTVECDALGPDVARAKRPEGQENASTTRLAEVMGDDVSCVRADVSIERVIDLVTERNLRAVPVVDESRRLVGIVSKTDLLRWHRSGEGASDAIASIMTPLVHGLPEDAPLAYAISLMAFEGLHEVPAVSADGRVVGMLTALDALRWTAKSLGYVESRKKAAEPESARPPPTKRTSAPPARKTG